MRIPMQWLRDVVEMPEETSPEQLHAALVRVGLEEEAVHGGDVDGPLVVGRVVSFVSEEHKNGKTVRWVQVDVGGDEPRGIVCGADNFLVGDLVVVALPGTVLPGGFEIAARKTYGHVSDGMMASARELGIGDDHDGILRLHTMGIDSEPGSDAKPLLGLDDAAVEVAVTPDRGYALSIRGIGREYSAATGAVFTDPVAMETPQVSGFPLTLTDDAPIRGRAGAGRFVARIVRNIDMTQPTPRWMVSRLKLAGIRSISLPVDITNYVMIESGQPTHAYDLDTVVGGITVRRARQGERIVTLDDVERTLDAEDLVIADDEGAIGIAGVMGGARTEVSEATRDVLIEAAWFDPVTVARAARRHKLPSEAQKRFARGVDPTIQEAAAERIVSLLVELAGGTADTLGAVVGTVPAPMPIALPFGFAERIMGVAYTRAEERGALETIGATVTESEREYTVTPPPWRPDLTGAEQLVEEIGRVVGFERIPSLLPVAPPGRGYTRSQRLRRSVAHALAAAGATEVLVAPFVTEAQATLTGEAPIKLANALDAERAWLRTALVPGLLVTAARNVARGLTDIALYELGSVFRAVEGQGTLELPASAQLPDAETLQSLDRLPAQPRMLALALTGARVQKQPGRAAEPYELADALSLLDVAARTVGVSFDVRQGQLPFTHPGRTALVSVQGIDVGYAGELAPSVAAAADLGRTIVAEIDLDVLIGLARTALTPRSIAAVPAATQDLTVVLARDVPAGDVLLAVREGAGALLEDIRIVDDYRGTGLAASEKALTFALRFRGLDTTLTAAQASEAKLAGLAVAAERFGAKLRD